MSDRNKSNWFSRHKVLTVFLVIIVIGIIGSIAAPSEDNGSTDKTPTTSDKGKTYRFADRADKQAKDVEVLPGEVATVNGVKMTVLSKEYKTSLSEYETAEAGKNYLVIDVAIENASDRTQPYSSYDFRLQTAGGQVLDPAISSVPTLESGDLVAGGKANGKVILQVPVEEGHQYLIWKPSLNSDRAIVQVK